MRRPFQRHREISHGESASQRFRPESGERAHVQRQAANLVEILTAITTRDAYDAGREIDPLRRAPDAKYVNTDNLTIPQVVERVKQLILNWPN